MYFMPFPAAPLLPQIYPPEPSLISLSISRGASSRCSISRTLRVICSEEPKQILYLLTGHRRRVWGMEAGGSLSLGGNWSGGYLSLQRNNEQQLSHSHSLHSSLEFIGSCRSRGGKGESMHWIWKCLKRWRRGETATTQQSEL